MINRKSKSAANDLVIEWCAKIFTDPITANHNYWAWKPTEKRAFAVLCFLGWCDIKAVSHWSTVRSRCLLVGYQSLSSSWSRRNEHDHFIGHWTRSHLVTLAPMELISIAFIPPSPRTYQRNSRNRSIPTIVIILECGSTDRKLNRVLQLIP